MVEEAGVSVAYFFLPPLGFLAKKLRLVELAANLFMMNENEGERDGWRWLLVDWRLRKL